MKRLHAAKPARDPTMYEYDQHFYRIMNHEAARSAEPIVRQLNAWLDVKSVVDFGCGQGAWLSVWSRQLGCDVLGVDGTEFQDGDLLVEASKFRCLSLSAPIDLERKFDLVQSLEVGEHLPRRSADVFVDSLCRHGSVVMFSAAPPGQGGECHINERPYAYWRRLFHERGYALFDAIRPSVRDNADISYWYRYNTFLYVHEDRISTLPAHVRSSRIPFHAKVPDVAPISMKLWRLLTRPMPAWYVTFIARHIIKPGVVRRYQVAAAAAGNSVPPRETSGRSTLDELPPESKGRTEWIE